MEMPFLGGLNKLCRSQPAGAKICLLVSLGKTENQFVGGAWAEPWGVFHQGKDGICLEAAGGAGDTVRGSGEYRMSLRCPTLCWEWQRRTC